MEPTLEMRGLYRLLSSALGDDVAKESIDNAARALGIDSIIITRQQALEILERVAQVPGIVGITARFAKSRIHMVG
jgi:hypothetical protein